MLTIGLGNGKEMLKFTSTQVLTQFLTEKEKPQATVTFYQTTVETIVGMVASKTIKLSYFL